MLSDSIFDSFPVFKFPERSDALIFLFQEVFSEVFNLTDKISDTVLDTMIPEQKSVVIKSQGVAIGLSKKQPGNLAGLSLGVGKGLGQFVLPDDNILMNRTKDNSYITATVSYKFNLTVSCKCTGD